MRLIEKHIDFYLIGISNHPSPKLNDDVLKLIKEASVFSGGKRHYQLVKSFLPKNHTWIEISGKMDALMNQYKKNYDNDCGFCLW